MNREKPVAADHRPCDPGHGERCAAAGHVGPDHLHLRLYHDTGPDHRGGHRLLAGHLGGQPAARAVGVQRLHAHLLVWPDADAALLGDLGLAAGD